jgi:hypothetical protein
METWTLRELFPANRSGAFPDARDRRWSCDRRVKTAVYYTREIIVRFASNVSRAM